MGVIAVAAVAGAIVLTGDDPDGVDAADGDSSTVRAAVVPAAAEAVRVLDADPRPDPAHRTWLDLSLPETTSPGVPVTGEITWTTPAGEPITGQVDLQRVDGAEWVTVDTVAVDAGSGTVDLDVDGTAIYRAAYGGTADLDATSSIDVTVRAGALLPSTVGVSAAPAEGDGFEVTASWATTDSVAIRGTLEVQQEVDGAWSTVGEITTGDTGAGSVVVPADDTDTDTGDAASFRLAYPGGHRFAEITSEPAVAIGDDVRAIPVSACSTDREIDVLARGAGCHFTPVQSGTFVVGHDYLDNAWWNAMPMGTVVELEGEQAGVYEVVERVMAPGRGAALGPASDWTCGDDCDVILQTCQGSDTGFTWLRRVVS